MIMNAMVKERWQRLGLKPPGSVREKLIDIALDLGHDIFGACDIADKIITEFKSDAAKQRTYSIKAAYGVLGGDREITIAKK